ncbi:MAG: FKBP-type peptidyl-prolyl cis-trans isomerase [Propionibacteriaceae bacterium]|nr:FKBP-type peptidyl-prolyl cis-trans isomerase [Propionibacteriaceae bacterium]
MPASRKAPTVEVPEGNPPSELKIEDEIVGGGAEAKAGDTLKVHYVGVSWSTGEQFDASWERGEPLEFQVGSGMVIEGWDKGLQGMKVGGRRRITIPPEMGYGSQGAGGVIGPNETLIFVCDLVAVN